jgi:uncharacterized coiled-coil protein SlyX
MDGNEEVVAVLKEIRAEAQQTNARLESLEGRFDFLERRVSKGFDRVTKKFDEIETQLVPELILTAGVIRQVRDLLETKLDDHRMVVDHEHRIKTLEGRDAPQP